jgi:hypothetical protein
MLVLALHTQFVKKMKIFIDILCGNVKFKSTVDSHYLEFDGTMEKI